MRRTGQSSQDWGRACWAGVPGAKAGERLVHEAQDADSRSPIVAHGKG